ncbi:RimK family protein [Azospirillum halopraeferens]|uniref:RimK family protein n=1 Tax=Azospirillum halopraeferens TaxID=34010 RepID=UPI0003F8BB69|nr:RimK family protein [Azospirillum halopraeferens]
MPAYLVVVDRRSAFPWTKPNLHVVTARDFVTNAIPAKLRDPRIINLSRSHEYLGTGYYCSLLAEARGDRVIPTVKTILDLSRRTLYRAALPEVEEALRRKIKRLADPPETSFNLTVFFGRADDRRFQDIARQIFDLFRCPILKVQVRLKETWVVHAVEPLALEDLKEDQKPQFEAALDAYTRTTWREPTARPGMRWSLAILHDPKEALPPSGPRALQKFIRAGESLGVEVDLIEKRDFLRLAEYDALFIREGTALDNHTYRFATKAEAEGMPVIDDPNSILKCTNKVYLAELLKANRIPAPRTVILDKRGLAGLEREIPFPIVLKIPDGSFSRGIFKVGTRAELEATAEGLFEESDLILAQEFMYTEFDWRVGVLNRKPIYVCQYLMARKHWQIVKHGQNGRAEQGASRTLLVEEAPPEVVETAVKAAALIGDGLYGVDLKQNDRGIHVIEINDNPSLDQGVEDARLKDELYLTVMREFLRRLEGR